jgi:hypothetical protein
LIFYKKYVIINYKVKEECYVLGLC